MATVQFVNSKLNLNTQVCCEAVERNTFVDTDETGNVAFQHAG